jgi:hypothetical protein
MDCGYNSDCYGWGSRPYKIEEQPEAACNFCHIFGLMESWLYQLAFTVWWMVKGPSPSHPLHDLCWDYCIKSPGLCQVIKVGVRFWYDLQCCFFFVHMRLLEMLQWCQLHLQQDLHDVLKVLEPLNFYHEHLQRHFLNRPNH